MAPVGRHPTNAGRKPKRSDVGIDLVRALSAEGDRIFSFARAKELSPKVGLKQSYLREALYHLKRTGWILPLRRGLYAVAPLALGSVPIHEFEIAMALVDPASISHWSALHHHGLTEQPPHHVFVTTTATSIPRVRGRGGPLTHGGYPVNEVLYKFIQVKRERFFGTEKVWIGEARVTITDPERTLLDGLAMPEYCGDFSEVLHAFQVRNKNLDLDRIIDYALRLDLSLSHRLGWVLENQGIPFARLARLQQTPLKGYGKLDPTGPRVGPYSSRWMIQENLPGRLR